MVKPAVFAKTESAPSCLVAEIAAAVGRTEPTAAPLPPAAGDPPLSEQRWPLAQAFALIIAASALLWGLILVALRAFLAAP